MKDEIISYETALLAKEKGFNEPVFNYFSENKDICIIENPEGAKCNINPTGIVSIPTQSLLQRWLREVHNIFITVEYDKHPEDGIYYYSYWQIINSPKGMV